MKAKIIVALDVPSASEIPAIVDILPPEIEYYKVGLELYSSDGPAALAYLKKKNKKIFLDLKLHDIPRTVARAVATAAKHNVQLLTIHSSGGREMIKAASDAANEAGNGMQVVAVTILTSMNQQNLTEIGMNRPISDQIMSLGELAISAGAHGLVCSPLEAQGFRTKLGSKPILITPGIRPAGADVGDQKRVATPASAVQAGANFLVIGRPILEAKDPKSAAIAILEEIQKL